MAIALIVSQPLPISVEINDFWQLDYPVTPQGTNSRTDVLLVQGMLVQFAMSNVLPEARRTEAMAIVTSMGGKRFDDGIYGPKTRALLKIFEDHTDAPVKDGIVRPLPFVFLTIPGLKINTKLGRLNDIWNFTMSGGALGTRTKKDSSAQLHPDLKRALYGF